MVMRAQYLYGVKGGTSPESKLITKLWGIIPTTNTCYNSHLEAYSKLKIYSNKQTNMA